MLLIVDDADAQFDHQDLARLLSAVVGRDESTEIRVVLAGRDFGGWWGQLRDDLDPVVNAKLRPPGHMHLSSLATAISDQEQLFKSALTHFSRHLGQPSPSVNLTNITPTTPVAELHAAAASAVYHGITGSVSIDDALKLLYDAEETWWQRNAAEWNVTLPLPLLQAAITTATLVGANSRAQCSRRLACLPGLTTAPAEQLDELSRWLHQLYAQRSGEWLDPHLPARLAERYASRCVVSQPLLAPALAAAALIS
ncbi:hypothetical protein [Streptomyces sp. NPDC093610]|uniref:hypothetical protein n=1 Tax=Streptomyces sp. NPDC093610 TaxID=3366048 RepID=UPI0037F978C9